MSLINDNWEKLFDKYNILEEVKNNGLYYISANQIKEFKEPRLMTKFDTRESLPAVFKGKLAILPVTRGNYVIGEFNLYEDFPTSKPNITQMINAKIPEYLETIDINNISSEAVAINVMGISSILNDFLGENNLQQTISGRMGSGKFSFNVGGHAISVENSQLEIDAGFENENVFTIIECKNVVHDNFLIRQLYYPCRLWSSKITKPIRPIFMVYSNNIFRLLEYRFTDINNYSSLQLMQERYYSLENTEISLNDIKSVLTSIIIEPEPKVTFVQANSFEKIISLTEHINESPMTIIEVAELFGFDERQSDYYFNACKYLGLAEKSKSDVGIQICITTLGKKLLKMPYKSRQLEYVKLILKHQIFNEMMVISLKTAEIPDKRFIANRMKELNICSDNLIQRRASSVKGWISWIINLVNDF